jgi:cbb3-type cytochrome c oxidase subunit III
MFGKLNLLLGAGIVVCLGLAFLVRRDYSEPNYELVPERQMGRSPAFGAYAPNPNFPHGLTLRQPPAHTIARGTQLFPYDSSPLPALGASTVGLMGSVLGEGPLIGAWALIAERADASLPKLAGAELKNPLSVGHPHAQEHGALLYATYCQVCHGTTGKGDGIVSERGVKPVLSFLAPQAEQMKDGAMFHIITYGKGNMPSHAAQLSPTDRWSAILHIRVLQNRFTEFPSVSLAETKEVYEKNCMPCHGKDGDGSLLRATKPTLPDFNSLAWQFSKSNVEIANRIEYGDEPLMPSFRYKLTRDQILALSIYIRSFAIKESGPVAKVAIPTSAAGMTPVQIYRAFCLACHNRDGKGGIVRPVMPDIPDFTLAGWHTSKKDAELSKSILTGGKFMPSMKDKLAAVDADRMAKFVRSFKNPKFILEPESQDIALVEKEKAKEKKKDLNGKANAVTVVTSPDIALRLRSASVLYREYCIACHGPDGTGVAAMRVTLPLLPDFTTAPFHTQHSDAQLLISILDGKGTQMPANRGRVNEAQARDLTLLLRAFGPAGIGGGNPGPDDGAFQGQFRQLQQQWETLERQLRALKQGSPKS